MGTSPSRSKEGSSGDEENGGDKDEKEDIEGEGNEKRQGTNQAKERRGNGNGRDKKTTTSKHDRDRRRRFKPTTTTTTTATPVPPHCVDGHVNAVNGKLAAVAVPAQRRILAMLRDAKQVVIIGSATKTADSGRLSRAHGSISGAIIPSSCISNRDANILESAAAVSPQRLYCLLLTNRTVGDDIARSRVELRIDPIPHVRSSSSSSWSSSPAHKDDTDDAKIQREYITLEKAASLVYMLHDHRTLFSSSPSSPSSPSLSSGSLSIRPSNAAFFFAHKQQVECRLIPIHSPSYITLPLRSLSICAHIPEVPTTLVQTGVVEKGKNTTKTTTEPELRMTYPKEKKKQRQNQKFRKENKHKDDVMSSLPHDSLVPIEVETRSRKLTPSKFQKSKALLTRAASPNEPRSDLPISIPPTDMSLSRVLSAVVVTPPSMTITPPPPPTLTTTAATTIPFSRTISQIAAASSPAAAVVETALDPLVLASPETTIHDISTRRIIEFDSLVDVRAFLIPDKKRRPKNAALNGDNSREVKSTVQHFVEAKRGLVVLPSAPNDGKLQSKELTPLLLSPPAPASLSSTFTRTMRKSPSGIRHVDSIKTDKSSLSTRQVDTECKETEDNTTAETSEMDTFAMEMALHASSVSVSTPSKSAPSVTEPHVVDRVDRCNVIQSETTSTAVAPLHVAIVSPSLRLASHSSIGSTSFPSSRTDHAIVVPTQLAREPMARVDPPPPVILSGSALAFSKWQPTSVTSASVTDRKTKEILLQLPSTFASASAPISLLATFGRTIQDSVSTITQTTPSSSVAPTSVSSFIPATPLVVPDPPPLLSCLTSAIEIEGCGVSPPPPLPPPPPPSVTNKRGGKRDKRKQKASNPGSVSTMHHGLPISILPLQELALPPLPPPPPPPAEVVHAAGMVGLLQGDMTVFPEAMDTEVMPQKELGTPMASSSPAQTPPASPSLYATAAGMSADGNVATAMGESAPLVSFHLDLDIEGGEQDHVLADDVWTEEQDDDNAHGNSDVDDHNGDAERADDGNATVIEYGPEESARRAEDFRLRQETELVQELKLEQDQIRHEAEQAIVCPVVAAISLTTVNSPTA